ncbi:hypothetical protein GH714_016246 [Hevea brasiliensis]|uniref:Uncharacterized protein n=1 Tax=Hevea brasiliensis TaxID=3981 RepID=A0A6A6MAE5_HEVBR|nr:hypothetical protein GH714_016246 [Hevea brasiliensis]
MASHEAWLALCGLWEDESEDPNKEEVTETELRRLPKLRLLIQLRLESATDPRPDVVEDNYSVKCIMQTGPKPPSPPCYTEKLRYNNSCSVPVITSALVASELDRSVNNPVLSLMGIMLPISS